MVEKKNELEQKLNLKEDSKVKGNKNSKSKQINNCNGNAKATVTETVMKIIEKTTRSSLHKVSLWREIREFTVRRLLLLVVYGLMRYIHKL